MIGWYVHHQGSGHLHRATAIAEVLDDDVVGLSSLPAPGGPFADWVPLADDAGGHTEQVTAGGALHWAPRRHAGLRTRMAQLAGWVERASPAAVVVDVSVEVTLFLRLMGVPVVVTAMPGDRDDVAHTTGYTVADRLLAFFPADVLALPHLAPFAATTTHVGAVSRFDGRSPAPSAPGTAVLLAGTGGSAVTADDVAALRRATPGLSWTVLGGPGEWSADPWPVLSAADVVVTHAGQNALAEVAAARRPAVVVAADRPFAEQRTTTAALDVAGLAVGLTGWPAADRWPGLLEAARTRGGHHWASWSPGDAAVRAAAAIGEVARS